MGIPKTIELSKHPHKATKREHTHDEFKGKFSVERRDIRGGEGRVEEEESGSMAGVRRSTLPTSTCKKHQ